MISPDPLPGQPPASVAAKRVYDAAITAARAALSPAALAALEDYERPAGSVAEIQAAARALRAFPDGAAYLGVIHVVLGLRN